MRRIRRLGTVGASACLVVSTLAPAAHAEVKTMQGTKCVQTQAYYACAWLNIDTTNHVIRAYGETVQYDGAGYVEADVRLFKNGYAVLRATRSADGYVQSATDIYACGGGHGFRSYNTYSLIANGFLVDGTIYSDLQQTACL